MEATSGESSKLLASGASITEFVDARSTAEEAGLGSTTTLDNGPTCESTVAFADEKPVSTMGITYNG